MNESAKTRTRLLAANRPARSALPRRRMRHRKRLLPVVPVVSQFQAGTGYGISAFGAPGAASGSAEAKVTQSHEATKTSSLRGFAASCENTTDYVSETGEVVAFYAYDAFGRTLAQSGPMADAFPFRFSTKYYDSETGLYYYGRRYYSPDLGRWLNRDPIEEDGGVNLYLAMDNSPTFKYDYLGLKNCNYCGPDVTLFLANLVNSAVAWRAGFAASRYDGISWLNNNGSNLDWWSTMGDLKVVDETENPICPTRGRCQNTYWLCGECVHDHWIGNFMYGFLGALFNLPDWMIRAGGNYAQHHHGDHDDPPWDTAGYGIARNTYKMLFDKRTNSDIDVCLAIKSDMALWKQANDTSASGQNYPKPHAKDYHDCEECPFGLPLSIQFNTPGGKFGSFWPPLKEDRRRKP